MPAGTWEAGMLKPLNLTSWKGARGDGEAEAQSSAGGLGQVRPTKLEQWRLKLQILKPSFCVGCATAFLVLPVGPLCPGKMC